MKSISCNAGYKLYQEGDLAQQLYIQRTGFSTKITKKKDNVWRCPQQRGSVIGEYSMIHKRRINTLVCDTFCEFYVIEVSDIIDTLKLHHGMKWERHWLKMKALLKKTYKMQISRSCKLLAKQNDMTDMHISADFNQEGIEGKEQNETNEQEMIDMNGNDDAPNNDKLESFANILSEDGDDQSDENKKQNKIKKKLFHHKSKSNESETGDKNKRRTLKSNVKNLLNRTASQYRNDKMVRLHSDTQRLVTMNGTAVDFIKDWKEEEIQMEESDDSRNTSSLDTDIESSHDSFSSHGFGGDQIEFRQKKSTKGVAKRKRSNVKRGRFGSAAKKNHNVTKKKTENKHFHVQINSMSPTDKDQNNTE